MENKFVEQLKLLQLLADKILESNATQDERLEMTVIIKMLIKSL